MTESLRSVTVVTHKASFDCHSGRRHGSPSGTRRRSARSTDRPGELGRPVKPDAERRTGATACRAFAPARGRAVIGAGRHRTEVVHPVSSPTKADRGGECPGAGAERAPRRSALRPTHPPSSGRVAASGVAPTPSSPSSTCRPALRQVARGGPPEGEKAQASRGGRRAAGSPPARPSDPGVRWRLERHARRDRAPASRAATQAPSQRTATYRGKYQFDYGTWASVGGSGDPAAAPEVEQDYRAALLYVRGGSSPWPICG